MFPHNQILKPLVDACEAVVPAALWQQHRCVVAVSGGADSVALFRTLVQTSRENTEFDASNIIVGHVDHSVRGADSKADKEFVQRLAGEFGVGFATVQLDLAQLLGGRESASEELLRDARYGCLKKIAQDHDARYLFTGHHLNDQAETILFRIFRGTGLVGLKGIPSIRRDDWLTIVRPLLKVSKEKILEALAALDQPFCTDVTNETNDYSRNFIRNEILKSAQDYFGLPVEEAIARLAEHAESALTLEADQVDAFLDKHPPTQSAVELRIGTASLAAQSPSVIRAVLIRKWSDQGWSTGQMTWSRWQSLAEKIVAAGQDEGFTWMENLPGDIHLKVDSRVTVLTSDVHSV